MPGLMQGKMPWANIVSRLVCVSEMTHKKFIGGNSILNTKPLLSWLSQILSQRPNNSIYWGQIYFLDVYDQPQLWWPHQYKVSEWGPTGMAHWLHLKCFLSMAVYSVKQNKSVLQMGNKITLNFKIFKTWSKTCYLTFSQCIPNLLVLRFPPISPQ